MSLGLGSTLISKGEISQRGGVLRTHWRGTEAPPDIAGWNGREWRRALFLTRDSGLLAGGWSLSTPSAGILSIGHHPGPSFPPQTRQRGLSPSHHRVFVASPRSSSYCTFSRHSTPLSLLMETPFRGSGTVALPSRLLLPFTTPHPPKHTLLAFFPLPFVCVLVHQRIPSQLDSATVTRTKRLTDLCPRTSPVGLCSGRTSWARDGGIGVALLGSASRCDRVASLLRQFGKPQLTSCAFQGGRWAEIKLPKVSHEGTLARLQSHRQTLPQGSAPTVPTRPLGCPRGTLILPGVRTVGQQVRAQTQAPVTPKAWLSHCGVHRWTGHNVHVFTPIEMRPLSDELVLLRIRLTPLFLVQGFLLRGSPRPVGLRLPSEKRGIKARSGDTTLPFEIETLEKKKTAKKKRCLFPSGVSEPLAGARCVGSDGSGGRCCPQDTVARTFMATFPLRAPALARDSVTSA